MISVAGGFRGSHCVTEIVPAMTEIQAGLHLDPNGKVCQHAFRYLSYMCAMSLAE